MSHHYVQQLVHVIWSTQKQQFQIPLIIRNQLYAYLSTVIKSKEGFLYLADGHADHIHCLLSLPPKVSIANMMKFIKASSSKWIKHQNTIDTQFAWEDGYTSISVQNDRVDAVCAYIKDEEKRHSKIGFSDELSNILKLQNIQYDEKYFLTNSYSKCIVHMIWSTKNRISFLDKSIRPSLYQIASEVICKNNCVVHAIGGIEDHIHLLVEISRNVALADLVKDIKGCASHWLHAKDKTFHDFEWQTGYGAFSISYSSVDTVVQYIMNQEEHHKKSSYLDEWNEFVSKKGV